MSDNQIQHGIVELLKARQIDGVWDFQVETHNGVAFIRGRVSSAYAKQACYECCRRVTGVVKVVDQLRMAGHN
jgi:osmotically-inducible protein OsmY